MALRAEVPCVAPAPAGLSFLMCKSGCFMMLPPSTELCVDPPSRGPSSQSAALSGCQGLAGLRRSQLPQVPNCCHPKVCRSGWARCLAWPGIPSAASGTLEHRKGLFSNEAQS